MIRKVRYLMIVAVVLAVISGQPTAYTASSSRVEYEVKAAFLYNFGKFVEWPDGTFPDEGTPIAIGVLGRDPFGSTLEETIKDQTVDGRRFVIKRSGNVQDLASCQILFISSSETDRLPGLLNRLRGSSILTVSDMNRFARRGGVIGFVMRDNKIGLEINVDAAKQARLKISSKLLRLATIVGG